MTETERVPHTESPLLKPEDDAAETFQVEKSPPDRPVKLRLRKVGQVCSRKFLYERLPILSYLATFIAVFQHSSGIHLYICIIIA